MEQESDYILREVKKLTLFITNLISNLNTSNKDELDNGIRETDDFIRKKWGISLKEITSISPFDFTKKFKELEEIHLEKLAELLNVFIKKIATLDMNKQYNGKELVKKGILLINILNDKSKTYSIKRMELKKELQRHLDS
ncbi:hypothetical protein N9Q58_01825 [Polaribacter sp.]|jgi:hypothetical protein|nr:hypothetical protein [Polaribacter sp.]|tara:strand:- start:1324 stop:1743 length:420 start_codon:yes stop_codon:yes gene_type:complete